MRINFRQGVVSYQPSGFLDQPTGTGGDVNILATNRSVTVTIAHDYTNYTHSEDKDFIKAWRKPFATNIKYWLYWDFNPLTFARTFGYTTLEPVAQSVPPGNGDSPVVGVIPGAAGIGAFLVKEYYNLPVDKSFAIIHSTENDGNYTVKSSSYDTITGRTTIYVKEAIVSDIVDGDATLDIDLAGNPLFTEDRHWFDTTTNIHKVLSAGKWVSVLRVFAALLVNGNTFISPSQNSDIQDFTGTQIGNNNAVFSGRVLFSEGGGTSSPMRRDDGTFFTTEDQFFTNQSRVDALRLESNVTRAQSVGNLSEFSVVAWVDDGQVNVAQYDDVGNTVVGLLTEPLSNLEVGAIIVQGVVTNPAWNWTGDVPVGSTLWVDNGEFVTVDPHINDPVNFPLPRVPVARVLDKDTIIFEQGLGGIGEQGPVGIVGSVPPADTTNIGGVILLTPSEITGSPPTSLPFVVGATDTRLDDARIPLPHTHQATDVSFLPAGGVTSNEIQAAVTELGNDKLNLTGGIMGGLLTLSGNPTADGHATTKQYVDNLAIGLAWLESIDAVNLIDDTISSPPISPNHGDGYIMPIDGSGGWSGILAGEIVFWDNNTFAWLNAGPVQDITSHAANVRIGIAMQSSTTPAGSFIGLKNQIVIFDTSGNISGFEIPDTNNAVYIESTALLFTFDQFTFDGTKWVRFGASSQAIVGDGLTIDISGATVSVIPSGSGGQVDALSLNGDNIGTLDLRWSAFGHSHIGTGINITPYLGDGTWGNAVDSGTGQITSTTVGSALNELADRKAEKVPSYATEANLPSAITEKGMVAFVNATNDIYFADSTGWLALARANHGHVIPYDMPFYVPGPLFSSQNIGIFTITRNVSVDAGAPGSYATAGKPASALPTTILIRRDVVPYGSPVTIGSIEFIAGSSVGSIFWTSNILFNIGDILMLTTDSTPSDLEEISVTIAGEITIGTILPGADENIDSIIYALVLS